MNAVRLNNNMRNVCRGAPGALVLAALMASSAGRVAAQPDAAAPTAETDVRAEPMDEIEVVGQRTLRDLRLDVQAARERIYDLFNSLNSSDDFDIHCYDVPRTGTRITQRECRPQYADRATERAATNFLRTLFFECGGDLENQGCLGNANASAQGALAAVPVRDQQLDAEMQRLVREHPELRRAITGFQAAESRYASARRPDASALRGSVAVVDGAGTARRSGLDGIARPEAVALATPDAPARRAGYGLGEGWVKLRYSVLADGSVAGVRAVDTLPAGLDPLSATAAVQASTFAPATKDGAPIDWHNNLAVVAFTVGQAPSGPDFVEAYEETAALIAAERYAEAKPLNERMQREYAVTLGEMALAQMQLAAIEHALGDPHAALAAIRRATEPAVDALADAELELALEHRFALELELGLAVDALSTYERRAGLGRLPSRAPLARLGAALEETLEAPQTSLAKRGRTDDNGHWEHALAWRTFTVGDVDGRIERIEVECNRNGTVLPADADAEVTIPAGWGDCVLLATGEPETTFVVYEFREPIPQL